jgi:hypothetical protein
MGVEGIMGRAAPRVNRKSVPFLAGWPSRSSQREIDGERHVKRASMVRRTENQRKLGLARGTSVRTWRALSVDAYAPHGVVAI